MELSKTEKELIYANEAYQRLKHDTNFNFFVSDKISIEEGDYDFETEIDGDEKGAWVTVEIFVPKENDTLKKSLKGNKELIYPQNLYRN